MSNRAVTIRCRNCGLEVTGVKTREGMIRPHDRARPELDAPVEDGYCMSCANDLDAEELHPSAPWNIAGVDR